MAEQGRHLHRLDPRRDRALDDASEALVVEPFENVGDQSRCAVANAGPFAFRSAQEAPGGAGDVDVAHPPGDHRGADALDLGAGVVELLQQPRPGGVELTELIAHLVARAVSLAHDLRMFAPRYGKLREPVQIVTNLGRMFPARSWDGNSLSDGGLSASMVKMGQNPFYSPTVFNYFLPEYIVPGTTLNAPEFQILNTSTAISRTIALATKAVTMNR